MDPTHPDALLQAFRLTNPGEFHRQLHEVKLVADGSHGPEAAEIAKQSLDFLARILQLSKRKEQN